MIVLKYQKTDSIRFISHIDLLRHVDRIVRRGELTVNYSQGFNPHPLLYFSPPLSLGIGSRAEYLTIDTPMAADEVLERFNSVVPASLKASRAFYSEKNPNLQARVVCADFVFDVAYDSYTLSDTLVVEYEKKGKLTSEDVRDRIYGAYNVGGRLCLRLASGSVNLRPDRLLEDINRQCGSRLTVCEVEKLRQYAMVGDRLVDVDELLGGRA